MEEKLLNIAQHNVDRTLSGRELERANAIQSFHSLTDASISPADRARISTGRVSAFRPYQKAVVGPYERPSLPAHRNRTTNGFSIDELLGNREAIDNAIPTLEDLVTSRPATPDPRYRELVDEKWVPSNWNSSYVKRNLKSHFRYAASATVNNRGYRKSHQYPQAELFSETWKKDVKDITKRRFKIEAYEKTRGIDQSETLAKNEADLLAYFHGDTKGLKNYLELLKTL